MSATVFSIPSETSPRWERTLLVVWGTFLAPKSPMRLDEPWLFLLELIVFSLACWALYSTGKVNLTITFGVVYILNKILMLIWRQ